MFSGPESGEIPGKDQLHFFMAESRQRILLVDADVVAVHALADYLRQRNFEVMIAYAGEQVMNIIADWRPDLVVMDVALPGLDGFDVCRALQSIESQLAIIILTTRTDEFDQVLGLELGADDYLAKPTQQRLLLARIKALLRRCGHDDRSRPLAPPLCPAASPPKYGEFTHPAHSDADHLWHNFLSADDASANLFCAKKGGVHLLEFGQLRIDRLSR